MTSMMLCSICCGQVLEDEQGNHYSGPENYIAKRHYGRLSAHGDYSKLKLIVRFNQNEYYCGEPVYITFFVRNDSDDLVHLDPNISPRSFIFLWKLENSQKKPVPYTPLGTEFILERKKHNKNGIDPRTSTANRFCKLPPGEELELDYLELNKYFDWSLPDEYRLTCFQINSIADQRYDPPLQSNTLTFRVLEIPFETNNEPKQWIPSSQFVNPPRGKEFFEQKKEPKNIFYKFDPNSEIREIIDISPHTYYRQRAEKY
jgi:hypothetical protein